MNYDLVRRYIMNNYPKEKTRELLEYMNSDEFLSDVEGIMNCQYSVNETITEKLASEICIDKFSK